MIISLGPEVSGNHFSTVSTMKFCEQWKLLIGPSSLSILSSTYNKLLLLFLQNFKIFSTTQKALVFYDTFRSGMTKRKEKHVLLVAILGIAPPYLSLLNILFRKHIKSNCSCIKRIEIFSEHSLLLSNTINLCAQSPSTGNVYSWKVS